MPDPITGSPLESPTITIGAETLSLKFTLLAELVADELKLDTREFFTTLRTSNVGKLSSIWRLFAAMVAHNYVAVGKPYPTPEQWALRIDALPNDEGVGKFREICDSVGKVLLSKLQASAAIRLQEPASAQGQALN